MTYVNRVLSTRNSYQVVIWIVGDPEHKQVLNKNAYSRGQGEAQAELYIDFKVLGIDGVLD